MLESLARNSLARSWLLALIFIFHIPAHGADVVVEDATSNNTANWSIYDNTPAGAAVTNEYDELLDSRVIQLAGNGTRNGFILGDIARASGLNLVDVFHATWRMRADAPYFIYIAIQTSNGLRHLTYSAQDSDQGLINDRFIFTGLGSGTLSNQWVTINRDLQSDLSAAEPGNTLTGINGFLVRGSMRLDDLGFSSTEQVANEPPTAIAGSDQNVIPDTPVTVTGVTSDTDGFIQSLRWTDANGAVLSSSSKLIYIPSSEGAHTLTFTAVDDDGDSTSDSITLIAIPETVVVADAEEGDTSDWVIYDNTPAGAAVNVELDDKLGSQVVQLAGDGARNGFILGDLQADNGFNLANRFHASWRMRTDSPYFIYIATQTSKGFRHLTYSAQDISQGLVNNRFIFTGLGSDSINDQWVTISRDLQADLAAAEPGNTLIAVNGFLVRGAMRLDDISFARTAPAVNKPPTVSAGADKDAVPDAQITLTGSATDNDGFLQSLHWTDSTGTVLSSTSELRYTPVDIGTYTLTFTAVDDDGASVSDTVAVVALPETVVIADAQDQSIADWVIYDNTPAGAAISNETDEILGSRVIQLAGEGTRNGFILGDLKAASGFDLAKRFHASWRMQTEMPYFIYIATQTTNGFRHLTYSSQNSSQGLINNRFIFTGLGEETINGQWVTINRDLQADLSEAEPGNVLVSINGFLVRGDMRLDDISFSRTAPPPNTAPAVFAGNDLHVVPSEPITLKGVASDGDGFIQNVSWTDASGSVLANSAQLIYTPPSRGSYTLTYTAVDDDGEAVADDVNIVAVPASVIVSDGEDSTTDDWRISDSSPAGATVNNVVDDILNSRVLQLSGDGTRNGFIVGDLRTDSGFNLANRFHASWRMRTDQPYFIYIATQTRNGFRHLTYSPKDSNNGLVNNRFVFTGLGSNTISDQWVTINRDLQADLSAAEPGNSIVSVNGFLVRGSMRLDDISFSLSAATANIPPVVAAGPDQSYVAVNTIDLSGTATDSDGFIQSVRWTDESDTVLANTAQFSYTPLAQGPRTLTFTAIDDDGDATSDTIVVSTVVNPVPDLSEYVQVFSDEFNAPAGSSLDPEKWDTGLLWGPYFTINNEEQLYVDTLGMHSQFGHSPFELTGTSLKITATPIDDFLQPPVRPDEFDPIWKPRAHSEYRYNGPTPAGPGYQASDVNYLSGMITSYESLLMTHGYIEMRAKLPAGRGLWPAFWMLNTHYVEDVPEIDVMEFLGQDIDRLYHTYHYFDIEDNWRKISTPSFPSFATDWTQDFHTFSMAWSPRQIIWYVDGREAHRINSDEYTIPNQAMYILANLAVGGNWPGAPDGSTVFPATFEIDYIRAYKRKLNDVLDLDNDYQIVFEDDFDGPALDPSKWNTHFLWGPYFTINNEQQYYVDALSSDAANTTNANTPFVLNDGILSITARQADDPNSFPIPQTLPDVEASTWTDYAEFQRNPDYTPGDYTSGIITSYDSFKFSYGYAEIRAQVPAGDGLWPAFWLLNGYYINRQPEIDIMEVRGEFPTQIVHSYHRIVDGNMFSGGGATTNTPSLDYSQNFHTYGARWQPGQIDWYIDGNLVHTYTGDDVGYQVMYVIANLAVGGDFSNGTPVDDVRFTSSEPVSMHIDYIRVYQERHKEND